MKLLLLALATASLGLFSCSSEEQKPNVPNQPSVNIDTNSSDNNVVRTRVNPLAPVDISPMDMSYLPSDYPVRKMREMTNDMPVARVIYSRPQKQNREIFGKLLKYGSPWRLGANEGTEIEFFRDVKVANKAVKKGRYLMYCVPFEKDWDIILNSNLYSWGLTEDTARNQYEFKVPVSQINYPIEFFTMVFKDTAGSSDLIMAWDKTEVRLPIRY